MSLLDFIPFKPISTRVHGFIDYLTASFLHALPYWDDWGKKSTRLVQGSATVSAAYSLMTDYELGLVRVLPMKAHLAMDAASGAGLLLSAAMLDDESPRVRASLAALGVFEIAAALMTKTESGISSRGSMTGSSAPRVPKGVLEPRRHAPSTGPVVSTADHDLVDAKL